MDVVALSLCSAFLFGAMTVALRPALVRGGDPLVGTLLTVLPALAVALLAALVRGDWELDGIGPFVLAGILAPGVSQVLFTFGVRDAGPSRTSAAVGTAPLAAVVLAIVVLDEPVVLGIVLGAILIVTGGLLLASERSRPTHVRRIGLIYAVAASLAFASRDTLVRWLAPDVDVVPQVAVAATLASGAAAILLVVAVTRTPIALRGATRFVPAGVLYGLSYVCLFEALFRGRLSVVAPLVATEALWGVGLSALLFRKVEGVGIRLLAGAALVVAGGVLIGLTR
ncbi:MAG: DMT family transporter [Gaiella sp.]